VVQLTCICSCSANNSRMWVKFTLRYSSLFFKAIILSRLPSPVALADAVRHSRE
jgi:hypothetical protein